MASANPLQILPSSGSQPFNSFTLFPELPFELRIIIWDMACPDRVLQSTFFYQGSKLCWQLLPSEKSPAVLFTCAESRDRFLPQYVPLMEEGISHPKIQYFGPSRDTIVFPGILGEDLRSPHGSLVDPIAHLAHRVPQLRSLAIYEWYHASISVPSLAVFQSLESLIILSPDGPENFEEVLFMRIHEELDSHQPLWVKRFMARGYWHVFAPGLMDAFEELEKVVVGWKAPGLRDGILFGRNCVIPPKVMPDLDITSEVVFRSH